MSTPVPLPHAAPVRPGQGTLVEQSRAQAEVMAAMLAAKQDPRDETIAQSRMQQVCRMQALAERAFFRFPRAGQTVSGASVHLARELARCWGNVHYEVKELSRDDARGESEMQAIAWDLETNARSSAIFIVPHRRDAKNRDGTAEQRPLTELRDVYENNANAGARRLRECIFAVLPLWFVEAAKDICGQTLRDGGGVPLPQRVARIVELFQAIGVSRVQLETKVGRKTGAWTEHDIGALHPVYQSIQRGEIGKDDEFPPEALTVTPEELAPAPTPPSSGRKTRGRGKAQEKAPEPEPAAEPEPEAQPTERDRQIVEDFWAGADQAAADDAARDES